MGRVIPFRRVVVTVREAHPNDALEQVEIVISQYTVAIADLKTLYNDATEENRAKIRAAIADLELSLDHAREIRRNLTR